MALGYLLLGLAMNFSVLSYTCRYLRIVGRYNFGDLFFTVKYRHQPIYQEPILYLWELHMACGTAY